MSVNSVEVAKLAADMARHTLQVGAKAWEALRKTGLDIEATSKTLVPVDTGATKGSIGMDENQAKLTVTIGPQTVYAPYLENGTRSRAPHPFMAPALEQHEPALEQALQQIGVDL